MAPLHGLVGQLAQGPEGGVDIHRIIGEGNLVATHTTNTGFGPKPLVAFDIFRFDEAGKILEHRDNMTPVAAPNLSGCTQTDGAAEVVDLDQTEAN